MSALSDVLNDTEKRTLVRLAAAAAVLAVLFGVVWFRERGSSSATRAELADLQTQSQQSKKRLAEARLDAARWREARRELDSFRGTYFYSDKNGIEALRLDLEFALQVAVGNRGHDAGNPAPGGYPPKSYLTFQNPPWITNAPSISLRILPNDEDFSRYYADPSSGEPVGNELLTFDVVYSKVLRTYYLLYPVMSQVFRSGYRGNAILSAAVARRRETARGMDYERRFERLLTRGASVPSPSPGAAALLPDGDRAVRRANARRSGVAGE